MSKHTLGPWSIEDETDITGFENDPDNGCVGRVDVAHVYLRMVPGRHRANANLIAAAPDLLAALKEVVRISDRKHAAWDAAKAAIAQAEG